MGFIAFWLRGAWSHGVGMREGRSELRVILSAFERGINVQAMIIVIERVRGCI